MPPPPPPYIPRVMVECACWDINGKTGCKTFRSLKGKQHCTNAKTGKKGNNAFCVNCERARCPFPSPLPQRRVCPCANQRSSCRSELSDRYKCTGFQWRGDGEYCYRCRETFKCPPAQIKTRPPRPPPAPAPPQAPSQQVRAHTISPWLTAERQCKCWDRNERKNCRAGGDCKGWIGKTWYGCSPTQQHPTDCRPCAMAGCPPAVPNDSGKLPAESKSGIRPVPSSSLRYCPCSANTGQPNGDCQAKLRGSACGIFYQHNTGEIGCTSCRDAKCKDTTFRAKSKPKACGCRLRNGKDPAAAGSRCATFKPHLIRDPDVLRAIRERSFVPKQCALITSAGGGQDCRACKQVKCPVDEHWHPPSDTGASESTATLPQQPDFGGVPELSRLGISSDNPQPGIDSPQAGFDTRAPFLPQQDFGDLGLNPEISSNFPLDTNLDFGKTRTIDTMANTHHTPSQQDSGNINWDDFLTLQYGEPDTALQSSGDPINPLPSRYNFYVGTNNFMAPSQPSQPHPGQQMMTPAVPLPSSSTPFWPQAQVLLEAPSTNTGLDRQALPSAAYRAQPQIPVQQQAQRQPPRTQLRIPHPQMMQRMPLQLGSVSNTSVRREPQIQIPAQQRSERRQPPVQQPSSAHQHYYRPQLTPQHNAQVPFYQHGPTITRDVRPGYFIDIGDLDQTIPLQQPILHQQQPAISSYHQRHPSASSSAISQANPNNSQLMVPSGSQHPRMPSQQHTQATPTNVPQDTYCYQYQQPANLQQPALPHHQQQAPASSRAFGSAPNRNESQQREDLRDLITPQQQQQQQRVTRSQSQTLPNSDTSQQPVSRQPTLATQPQKRAPPSSSSGSSYNNSPSGGSANDDDDGDEQHEAKEEERDNSKKKEKHKGKKTRT